MKTLTATIATNVLLAGLVVGTITKAHAQSSWLPTSNYPVAAYQYDPVANNGFIYVVGGYNGNALSNAFVNRVNQNGTLGDWTATTSLPESDQGPGAAIHRDWIYVALSSGNILRAQILPNGSLGAWVSESPVQQSTSYRLGLKAYKGYLYLFGRYDGAHQNIIRIAQINADGSLGPWASGTMPAPRHHSAVHFLNDRVYLIGGITSGDAVLDSVYSAPVGANGSLGAWRSEQNLPTPLWYHNTVRIGNDVFLLGGLTGYSGGHVTNIYRGKVNPADGTLGGWAIVDSMPSGYVAGCGAVYVPSNGYAYLIGGNSTEGAPFTDQVWHKPFGPAVMNLHKAVYVSSFSLLVGTNYQLQVSADMSNWTNHGTPFTATNSHWRSDNYWDVDSWDKLFFRLQSP